MKKTKKPQLPDISEDDVKAAIIATASAMGISLWRNNVGGLKTPYGGFVRFGLGNVADGCGGSPDLIGIMPGGRFLGVEVKRPKGRRAAGKPSPEQIEWVAKINAAGGLAFFAWSVQDFLDGIKRGG